MEKREKEGERVSEKYLYRIKFASHHILKWLRFPKG